ncbi:MAG TPA: GTP-binding protein [Glycomyces sp.]|nr:GTP-binding protein [Glycomyces sp.]
MSELAQPGAAASPTAELRPALTILTGFTPAATRAAAELLLAADPSLLVVDHDLTELLATGRLHRLVRDGTGVIEDEWIELEHGCVSCTLREAVLPALVRLAGERPGRDLALVLPPAIEPSSVAAACTWHHVDGRPVADAVELDSVVAVCDAAAFMGELDAADDLADRALHAAADDDRGVADVVARQVEYADTVLLWAPEAEPDFERTRLAVLLERLNPWARHLVLEAADPAWLSSRLRRSGGFDPDGPDPYGRGLEGYALGRHEPEADCGVVSTVFRARRPFHPDRFHRALPALAERTLRGRGHLWLATEPDRVLAWESGGGGVAMGDLGAWLAAGPDEAWDEVSAERRANADLNWDADFGDREVHLAFVGLRFEAAELTEVLRSCLLTDAELGAGREGWSALPNPFAGCFTTDH